MPRGAVTQATRSPNDNRCCYDCLRRLLRELRRRRPWRERAGPEHALPPAGIAPTGTEPRHEPAPDRGLDADRHLVTVRTAVALREDPKEDERGGDDPQNEEAAEDEHEDGAVRHDHLPAPLPDACVEGALATGEPLPAPTVPRTQCRA